MSEQVGPMAVSFLDELQYLAGLAFARLQLGDGRRRARTARRDDRARRLDRLAPRSGARPPRARSAALLVDGRVEGRAARAEADRLLDRLHVPATGWDRVFTLAAGAATHA